MDLTTASGDDDGVYRVTVQVRFVNGKSNLALGEGLLVVTKP